MQRMEKEIMRTPSRGSRRAFLKAAGATALAPMLVPSRALGLGREMAPSNRISVGLIGCGGRMNGVAAALARVPGVEIRAVCDVYDPNRERFRKQYKLGKDDSVRDFRELIARDDIDAVAIASPDHWHVPQSIAAIRAGKDVYCEKPLSNTIAEGRALADTVARYGAIFQHGTQLHSASGTRRACELVRNGYVGELKQIIIGSPPGRGTGVQAEAPIPKELDYDLWLGPAPVAPFTPARVFRHGGLPGWYFISDYSKSGWLAGFGVHDIDIAQWGMGLERSGPVSVEGRGVYPQQGLFDTIMTFRIEFTYANGVKIVMTDTGQNRHGVKFIGEDGWVFTRGGIEAEPRSILGQSLKAGDTRLYRSPDHAQNFIDCVRSRRQTITPAEIAHRATSTALLSGIACKLERPLRWDPEAEIFPEAQDANRLLSCALRAPWVL
ncbi:MAG: Gfo/Idh/MocA family oxidoreductase [Lentisphaerae bacterium]|mgnify:CR=1 FL=1|jgi:myo-inositol 2-dehydrogenase / D-chiro-inositol 1-dehydrogenase|nr:Gfo/Idh/MocA family oxidoreductase [Lentisphaerota bacterium]MBT4819927.1 Gfo/Idh/MocA family oxidoreductase [Lentisphaerota bacterium]MBT5610982.1 Gfo/Idh/MocA family oxidoreductase [Lentisphaerota bacterium]MBT7059912.1 Gfo/Idh/MocA family oxidoreductase [Lentisphaerota bacterium]MBT7848078.1 Gfo/Idh/MocA family oxidoreductase [Lentisphaerota bacterium]